MRLSHLALAAIVVGLSGVATAGNGGDEALAIDLSAVDGGIYYLKCSNSKSLTDCGTISIWAQTNELDHLQVSTFNAGNRQIPRDSPILA